MTPGARVQAAIEILDRIATGTAAEKALLGWSRGARYAGSKDRAAVRDHVFDVLRRWDSTAARGGAETGRARMIGLLREDGPSPTSMFTGEGHAPAPLTEAEHAAARAPDPEQARDLPGWLWPVWRESLGDRAGPVAEILRHRAPLCLRVNTGKADRAAARLALTEDGIETVPVDLSPTALRVVANPRRVARSRAYLEGLVELQDAASQAIIDLLPLGPDDTVLDFCAGGGGKALAMAARGAAVTAHDVDPARMGDLPGRAARAGVAIRTVADPAGPFDLVLADAPCSGSGAWRRAPEGKWRLTPDRLEALTATQDAILAQCAALVRPGGVLAYATCSVLTCENEARAAAFLSANPGWRAGPSARFLPDAEGDGLFVAAFERVNA